MTKQIETLSSKFIDDNYSGLALNNEVIRRKSGRYYIYGQRGFKIGFWESIPVQKIDDYLTPGALDKIKEEMDEYGVQDLTIQASLVRAIMSAIEGYNDKDWS